LALNTDWGGFSYGKIAAYQQQYGKIAAYQQTDMASSRG
jgi:hypothetical protein